jgi:hypothetical protein
MPTLYGPVDLRFKLSQDGKILKVAFDGQWREKPNKIFLHIPPISGLAKVEFNGRQQSVKELIELKSF